MSGTYRGGMNAAKTNKQLYGENYYKTIGKLGGFKSRGGGFADRDLAKRAGQLGGLAHRKPVKVYEDDRLMFSFDSIQECAEHFGISRAVVSRRIKKGIAAGLRWE